MKKIIQGVMFNTETAKEIANWGNSVPSGAATLCCCIFLLPWLLPS